MFLPLIGYIVDRIPLFHSEAKATCRCSSLQSMHMHDAAVTGRSLTLLLIQIHALLGTETIYTSSFCALSLCCSPLLQSTCSQPRKCMGKNKVTNLPSTS